jgi:antitoxin HicB
MNKSADVHATEIVEDYLKRPYARIIIPDSDGTFRGEVMEFPGCIATGETPAEALENLEEAARSWLLSTMALGQVVPQPIEDSSDYSGRFVLRLPRSLHKKAALTAEREGTSLNQFIVYSLAETIGERKATRGGAASG